MWAATPTAASAGCVTSTDVPGLLSVTCDGTLTGSSSNDPRANAAAEAQSNGSFGWGGVGGNANDVVLKSTADITVSNLRTGVLAMSTGGAGAINASGTGGNGGDVDVTVSGLITVTSGTGISAQSSGGMGGVGGTGVGGGAGDVTVQSSATITSRDGIIATSRGGLGGTWGGTNGVGGSVTVSVTGSVSTSRGVGVVLDAGSLALLRNSGRISAGSGQALSARGGAIEVYNSGEIIGNVVYANAADGIFENTGSGRLFSGASIDLNGGTFLNYGTLSPGGSGAIQVTELSGKYVQATAPVQTLSLVPLGAAPSVGTFVVDADWASGNADRLDIKGAAELSGAVTVNALNFPDAEDKANEGLSKSFTILTATGGVTDYGMTVTDTAAVDFELLYPDANTVELQATINFLGQDEVATANLTSNQTQVGTALNETVGNGGNPAFVPNLLALGTQEELGAALDQLTPAGDAAQFSSAMKTGNTFAGQLLSCKTLGEGDPNAFIREGQCLWVRANVRQLENDGRNGETGFAETATFYSAGAQFDVGGPWRIGAGIGFEDGDVRTGSNAQSETERLHLGAVVKYNPGPLLLAASLTGGHGWSDNTRVVSLGAFSDVATSDSEQSFLSGRLSGAYLLSRGHWYMKPQIDLAWTYLDRDGYTETASGGSALTVAGSDDTVFSVAPSLEFGAQYDTGFGGVARPYVKGGVTWLDSDTFLTSAAFAGVPGAAGFTIESTIDDVVADLGLGVDFLSETGTVLRVQYDAQFGDQTEQHGGSAKLSVPF